MELNSQTLEEILTRQRVEYQRFMGAQVEGLRSDIQLLAEAVSRLNSRVNARRFRSFPTNRFQPKQINT